MGSTDVATMFHDFGITTRWHCEEKVAPAPVAFPKAPKGKMLEDFKYRHLNEDSSMLALVAQVQPLYDKHFHSDLLEDLKDREGCMVTFLVADEPVDKQSYQPIGFIVYKFWGAPLRSMSILRVAVFDCYRKHGFGKLLMQKAMEKARKKPRSECSRVTLHGVPEALRFYERLNFTPIPEENLCDLSAADVDADITPMTGAVWMEYRCGREYKPPRKRR
jgi:ribosomal protein S18 acetylase RimI-like enzyme